MKKHEYKCDKCNHKWYAENPQQCPKCTSDDFEIIGEYGSKIPIVLIVSIVIGILVIGLAWMNWDNIIKKDGPIIRGDETIYLKTIQASKVIDTIYSDGTHYVGELKDNKKTGKGNCTYANGNTYIGEYENNLANGQGSYIGVNGNTYIGTWQDNKPNGQGIYTWGEGPNYADVYVGEFKEGNPHGQGTYTWGSGTNKGDEYIGEFMDNTKTGKGTCTYVNGDIYVGEWKDDKSHGQGIFTTNDGRILEGLFENGEYIDSAYQSNLKPEDVISDDDIVKE